MNPVNIMDRDFKFLGQLDNYTSYMPSKSWHGIGSVELHLHQSAHHTEHLQKENIIYTSADKAYIILHRELNSETGKMVIKGRELKSYLSRWLIYPPEGKAYFNLSAAPETIMKTYVEATLERKGVTEIVVAPDLERGEKTSYQARYKNLADELEKLSLDSGLNWDLRLDFDAKKFVFDCYVGLDRSANQDVNANAIFSVDYDNITSQKLIDSKYGFANMALVAGQGEGEWRVVEEVGETGAGLDSYELFVDARDIEYDEFLADRGRQKLAELPEKLSFDSVVDTSKNLKYGTDFNLGDVVTIANKSWGITTDRIITEIKEIYEPDGFRLEVTFGEGPVTIQDKIKQLIDSPIAEGGGGDVSDGGLSYPLGNVRDFTASVRNETVTLSWADPSDRYIFDDVGDPVPIAVFEGTKILRKEESYPVDEKDGVLVVDSKTRDQYKTIPYVDSGLTNGVEYFYMAFPYTDRNVFTVDAANRVNATPSEYTPDPTTWAGIQEIIRRGLTTDFFAVGDQITSTFGGSSMKWDIIGINHDIPTDKNYTNSMTLQAHDILESRAWHSSNANRYINSTGRAYLNDTSATGFIGKIDPALAAVIGAVDKQVTKNDSEGGGQDLFSDKVFHLSRVEVNLGTEGATTGESVYAFYQGAAGADRIKTLSGTATIWWLRSPNVDTTSYARRVNTDGSLHGYNASNSRGFAPALVIY